MKIWIDADACPVVIKEILFKAAVRTQTLVTMVANQSISKPTSPFIKMLQVGSGFDVADDEIVKLTSKGDLVITSDIPLAAEVIEKGGHALSPSGEHTGGPPPLNQGDRQAFANHLDHFLVKKK